MKKILLTFIVFSMCITMFPTTKISAEETIKNEKDLITEFIKGIEATEGEDFDKVVIAAEQNVDTGYVEIAVDNLDGSFTIYSTISEEDEKFLMTNPTAQTRGIWDIIKTAYNIIKRVVSTVGTVCKVVEYITSENVCSMIGKTLLDSLVINKRYKATAVLKKNMTCVPLHSAQCNTYPNVYWETTVVPA